MSDMERPLLAQNRHPGVSFSILAWSRSC
jgi:hypothetical protein